MTFLRFGGIIVVNKKEEKALTFTLILYILRTVAALVCPVAAFVYLRNKFSGNLKSFFNGVAVYFIFYCLIYAVISTYLEMFTKLFENIEGSKTRTVIGIIFATVCVALGYVIWFKAAVKKKNDNGTGLMTGVGFASCISVFAYALPSVVNAVIAAKYIKNPNAQVSAVFEENVAQVLQTTPLLMFYDLLELIFLFVLETAVATVFYRVLCCEDRKITLVWAFLLRIAAYTAISLDSIIDGAVAVLLLGIATLIAAGTAHLLIKPFERKKE